MTQGEFILTLLHAATNAHLLHLQSQSYSEHMALGTFYEELPELVDSVVESIQGLTGEIMQFPEMYYHPAKTGIQELEELLEEPGEVVSIVGCGWRQRSWGIES